MTVLDHRPAPISTQDQAKSITRSLAHHRETYLNYGDIPQVMERMAFQMGLDHEEVTDLYTAYLSAETVRDEMEWTGRPPWDDRMEANYQAVVHRFTAELSRLVDGPVTADTLDDLLR